MTLPLYHVPILSRPDLGVFRAPGAGLGNLLFPIARALIGQRDLGGRIVIPTMRQIKLGTYIRREADKRTYGEVFKPRSFEEITTWLQASIPMITRIGGGKKRIVEYHGLGGQFHDLQGHETLIRDFLKHRSKTAIPELEYDIAIHVRRNDFQPPETGAALQNTQTPMAWYREAFDVAKDRIGKPNPSTVVFTDADPLATIKELGVGRARLEPEGNALTSIFALSQARIIIASRSTFSLWAQYLGGSHAIWPNGFRLELYKPIDADRDLFL